MSLAGPHLDKKSIWLSAPVTSHEILINIYFVVKPSKKVLIGVGEINCPFLNDLSFFIDNLW